MKSSTTSRPLAQRASAVANLAQAKAQRDQAELDLSYTTVRAAQPSVPAWDEEMDLVGNVVAQFEQRERALVGHEGLLWADG